MMCYVKKYTITFLGKLKMVEEKPHVDFRWSNPLFKTNGCVYLNQLKEDKWKLYSEPVQIFTLGYASWIREHVKTTHNLKCSHCSVASARQLYQTQAH